VRRAYEDFSTQFVRAWSVTSRWLPQGWVDALRQLALFAGAYYLYRIVRGLVDGRATLAFENARTLVVTGANWMYVNSHFVITTTFLIWLYIFRNHAYYYVRNMFMIAMGLALVGYVAFPTAPPRYMPEWGFTDTVAAFVGPQAEASANLLYNPFAAVPSMHVAFALMIAVPAMRIAKRRVVKAVWAIYPALVTFVVVVTANHFWLDAALGAMVAGASAWGASYALGRVGPEAWAWRESRAEAVA
jgi:membrane-associated phospholipid phosphatase